MKDATQVVSAFLAELPNVIAAELPAILAVRSARQSKPDGSYVTRGDLLVQELILSHIRKHLPHAIIVSEEMALPVAPGEDCIIVVDPIDGTENFTSGLPEWGVSVASYDQGNHVASLLGCPEMNVWLRSGMILPRFTSRIRGLSSSLSREDILSVIPGHEYRIVGCCVYNMIK